MVSAVAPQAAETASVPVKRRDLTRIEQLVGVGFGLWMVLGLFLDGWAHDNNQTESFFTPWHGVLYSGFTAAAAGAFLVAARSRRPERSWLETLPKGHGLTLVALAVFAAGAMGDLLWHQLLGIEVGVEALLSPTHLVLLVGGVLALSAPVRTAWTRADVEPNLRQFAPTVLALALLTAIVGFFLLYLSPFVNNAAGTSFERGVGAVHEHPAVNSAELRQLLGIASILMTTVLYSVPAYLVLKRWHPPAGTFTILFGTVTLLFVGLDEFNHAWLILAGIVGGTAADSVSHQWPAWASVTLGISVLWAAYFTLYQLTAGGVAWSAALWTGTIVLSALISAGIGLVASTPDRQDRPPVIGQREQVS